MFEIERAIEIDAGHRVPSHQGGCRFLHGHRYRVSVHVAAPDTVAPSTGRSDAGMVTDFGVLKQFLHEVVHKPFDHKLILWDEDPICTQAFMRQLALHGLADGVVHIPCIPTAEELAQYWGRTLAGMCADHGLILTRVTVRETPNSYAVWTPKQFVETPLENLVLR